MPRLHPYRLLRVFLLMTGFFSARITFGQNYLLQKGNEFYDNMAYAECIPYFEKYLTKKSDSAAIVRVAEAYRLIKQFARSEQWYARSVEIPNAGADLYFRYAQVLLCNGKYPEAKTWFLKYAAKKPDDLRASRFAELCDSAASDQKKASLYEFRQVPFNSRDDDFSPMFYRNGIVFSSNRSEASVVKNRYEWDNSAFLDLYYVQVTDSGRKFGSAGHLRGSFKSRYHEGTTSYDRVNGLIYFTRNSYDDKKMGKNENGVVHLRIYSMKENSQSWKDVRSLPFNSNDYSVGHPAVSADAKWLFFVSDMPGGFGGTDVYVSEWKDSVWGPARNLGAEVNTPGNEMFPFMHKDGTLYFASDGHPGWGGLDIFSVDVQDGKAGSVTHLGGPVNSSADDFSYILDTEKRTGYFSSNRTGGKGGDDLYQFTLRKPEIPCFPQKDEPVCVTLFEMNTEQGLTDTAGLEFEWDLGGGIRKYGREVDHCFPGPGNWPIVLRVVDRLSRFTVFSREERIIEIPRENGFFINAPDTIVAGEEKVFDAASAVLEGCRGGTRVWDFGAGFTKKGDRVLHRYTIPGAYVVKMKTEGKNPEGKECAACVSKTVIVVPKDQPIPVAEKPAADTASQKIAPPPPARQKVEIASLRLKSRPGTEIMMLGTICSSEGQGMCYAFTAPEAPQLASGLEYEWEFGDGSKAPGTSAEYCYPAKGEYHVKLRIIERKSGNLQSVIAEFDQVADESTTLEIEGPSKPKSLEAAVYRASIAQPEKLPFVPSGFLWQCETVKGPMVAGKEFSLTFPSEGISRIYLMVSGKEKNSNTIVRECTYRDIYVDVPMPRSLMEKDDEVRIVLPNLPLTAGDNPIASLSARDSFPDETPEPERKWIPRLPAVPLTDSSVQEEPVTITPLPRADSLSPPPAAVRRNDTLPTYQPGLLPNPPVITGTDQRFDPFAGTLLNKEDMRILDFFRQFPDYILLIASVTGRDGRFIDGAEIKVHLVNRETQEERIYNPRDPSRFHFALESRTEFVIVVEKKGYLTLRQTLSTSDYKPSDNIYLNFVLDKAELNRRFVLNDIYFDFDRWDIRPDAAEALRRWAVFLNDNPRISIELSSHTDSRGEDAYNIALSQRRAESTVNFLIQQGVDRGRMMAVGYGEQQPVNRCLNAIPCTEEEFAVNRRTEFRIVGLTPELSGQVAYTPTPRAPRAALPVVPSIAPADPPAAFLAPALPDTLPPGTTWRVQIGLFRGENTQVFLYNLREYYRELKIERDGEFKRYTVGEFQDFALAVKLMDTLRKRGYADAFVVMYQSGKRVSR